MAMFIVVIIVIWLLYDCYDYYDDYGNDGYYMMITMTTIDYNADIVIIPIYKTCIQ